jgi:NTE family protein
MQETGLQRMSKTLFTREQIALVLQGGGALGAYQAGVYEALHEADVEPDWIAGISIGAINAALIAGTAPGERIEKLHAFWDKLSSRVTSAPLWHEGWIRSWFNEISASMTTLVGVPGFFEPRLPPAIMASPGTIEAISYYDTTPLRKTLLELIDFDRINAKGNMRLSVGAVNIRTGNFKYFDTQEGCIIGPEHIMASGALPPGFAPIIIDGEPYWDGGLVSNTPLQHILDARHMPEDICIFQVDLFSAKGALPKNMGQVAQREKDIRFSSRTRYNTDMSKQLQRLRAAAYRLSQKLPASLKADPDAIFLANQVQEGCVTIMHLINRPEAYETQSKDYEFSRTTIDGHWSAGHADVIKSFADLRWKNRQRPKSDIAIFDLCGDKL